MASPDEPDVPEVPAPPKPEGDEAGPTNSGEGRAGGAGRDPLLPLVAESPIEAEELSERKSRASPATGPARPGSSEPTSETEPEGRPTKPTEPPPEPAADATPARRRRRILARFDEPLESPQIVPVRDLRRQTRRDFLIFGAGTAAAAAAFWWVLPDGAQDRILTPERREWLDSMEARAGLGPKAKEKFLNRTLTFDDDVAEALYSRGRRVRTYRKSDITPLRNNYDGQTPDPDYIPDWTLEVDGLASGKAARFAIGDLTSKFRRHDQITRLCCVEGWSAIAWWGGLRFGDLLEAYPPAPGFRWAKLESSVNLDSDGDPDPYFVSIDLETARHPQTLLATHQNDLPLTVEHGAPLRLLAPMKLGLKNIKAVTKIAYSREEPPDYWALQGYSKYDGL